jgi:hypothetical protein
VLFSTASSPAQDDAVFLLSLCAAIGKVPEPCSPSACLTQLLVEEGRAAKLAVGHQRVVGHLSHALPACAFIESLKTRANVSTERTARARYSVTPTRRRNRPNWTFSDQRLADSAASELDQSSGNTDTASARNRPDVVIAARND